jgi:hypothetical protein
MQFIEYIDYQIDNRDISYILNKTKDEVEEIDNTDLMDKEKEEKR